MDGKRVAQAAMAVLRFALPSIIAIIGRNRRLNTQPDVESTSNFLPAMVSAFCPPLERSSVSEPKPPNQTIGSTVPGQPPKELLGTSDVLDRLMQEIQRRASELPSGSYTTQLIEGGVEKMGAKILEEAAEVVEAAGAAPADDGHLVYEACDLIYHLWVLLGSRGISVDALRAELARREGTSGIQEKRQRRR